LGETAALAYKVDVLTRTKEWVGDRKDAVVSAVTGAGSKVGDITPDGEEVTYRVGRMKRLAQRSPLGLAIGGGCGRPSRPSPSLDECGGRAHGRNG